MAAINDRFAAAAWRIGQTGLDTGARPVPVIKESEGPSFADTLKNALNGVSDAQDNAAAQKEGFLNGEPVELHQVMAAGEEAGIALEMMVEIRNKVLEAYKTVISMQS